jgi:tyrosine-protein phosphatase SIW14
LVKEPLSVEYVRLMQAQGIAYHVIPIIPNKTPGVCTPQSTINRVLEILINPENHPVLVHCNKGKVSLLRAWGDGHERGLIYPF